MSDPAVNSRELTVNAEDDRRPESRLTNRNFADRLGRDLIEPVTRLGADAPVREVTGVGIFDQAANHGDFGEVQLSMAPTNDAARLMESLAASTIPGVVVADVPDSFDLDSAQTWTEATGIVIWCRAEGRPWIEILDRARAVVEAEKTSSDVIVSAVTMGDVPRLAEALADFLGGAVIIEDAALSVLGYSVDVPGHDIGRDTAILSRSMPVEWVEHLQASGILDRLRGCDEAIELRGGPFQERQRLIAPIMLDGRFGGVIWLAQNESELPDDAAHRLRVAAESTAPHLRRLAEFDAHEKAMKEVRVRSLLSGEVVSRADVEELGISLPAQLVLVAMRLSDGGPLDDHEKQQLQNAATLSCRTARAESVVVAIGDAVYCLVSAGSDHARESLSRSLHAACSRTLHSRLHLAASEQTDTMESLPRLRRQVDMILESLGRHAADESRVLAGEEAAPTLLLDEFAETARRVAPVVRYIKIERLRDHDRTHGTEYEATLGAYLDANGQVPRAAGELNVHPTTFRYRLRRITELFGIDIDSPEERTLCHVLLRV